MPDTIRLNVRYIVYSPQDHESDTPLMLSRNDFIRLLAVLINHHVLNIYLRR